LWRLSDFLAYFSNDVPCSHAHWHQNKAGSTALPQRLWCHCRAVTAKGQRAGVAKWNIPSESIQGIIFKCLKSIWRDKILRNSYGG